MKTSALTAAALALAATAALASPAFADGHGRHRVQPSAPLSVAEALGAGGGTVAGTVTRAGATWLTLSDGQATLDVQARGFLPDGIKAGDPITVTGGLRRGALTADHIVLADGTALAKADTRRDHRGDRRHGDDEDD